MGVGREIRVQFLGDNSDLMRASASSQRATSSLGSTLKKVGAMAALGLGVGLAVAGRALVGMTKSAVEDEAAQAKLATAYRKNADATDGQIAASERWITKQGEVLGVYDDDLRPALGRLVTSTKDVGKAQDLASLAMDVSAGSGKSLESVSMALMKANNGNVGALARLGINTKNAAGETITMEQATRRMADTFGGAALAHAQTLGGKMERLKLILSEAGEAIGAKLIPKLTQLADWFLSDGIPMMEKFGQGLMATGRAVAKLAGFVDRNRSSFAALTGAILALIVVTKIHGVVMAIQAVGLAKYARGIRIVAAATRVWAAVQWLLNAALSANPVGIVIMVLVALAVALVVAYKRSSTFRDIVNKAWSVVKVGATVMWAVIKAIFSKFVSGLQAVGRAGIWLWNNALAPAFRFIAGGLSKLMAMWASMLRALSHVPGFGWAGAAARSMQGAANAAANVAANIRNIQSKSVTISVHTRYSYSGLRAPGGSGPTRNGAVGGYATGTNFAPGGAAWVGEEGPELVDLPRGSRVTPHRQSMARARMGGGSVHLHFHGIVTDPRAAAREIARLLREEKLLSGRELGIS